MIAVKGNWKLNPKGESSHNKIHQYGALSESIGKAVNQNIKHNKDVNLVEDMWVFNMTDQWCEKNVNLSAEEVEKIFLE